MATNQNVRQPAHKQISRAGRLMRYCSREILELYVHSSFDTQLHHCQNNLRSCYNTEY